MLYYFGFNIVDRLKGKFQSQFARDEARKIPNIELYSQDPRRRF